MPGTIAYREPAQPATYSEKIKRSEFIANVSVCHSDEEAREFIAQISSQYRDATHNCRAFILADGTEYSSDDGEPSGTAGKPILNAIKHCGLVNTVVVVTRYFGGVKLGVRGLIDAYGETAQKALEIAGSVERIMTRRVSVSMGYAAMGTVTRLLDVAGASGLEWDFGGGESVRVICDVPESESERVSGELEELTVRGLISGWEYHAKSNN
ncbi:MAG: YigZ family protein [Synergistaceae bacterium]|nr:YigZ family protein [Synergistaceae bacterium]